MEQRICIHAHCYQPPRENPWLEDVELQDSAYPYHDWNSRITAECYGPNTASRILGPDKKIIDIINNFSLVSFNFGPTLLSWMQKNDPLTYRAILEADARGSARFSGHGCALAQAYNHMVMPLANSRDKRTQIIWGLVDFESRFKRKPEGMWLPETAVDLETLDIMAEFGILFTILSPGQAKRIRKIGDTAWKDVANGSIDPKLPYLCKLPSGRSIALFFYDGPISHDIAFGKLLSSGEQMLARLKGAFDTRRGEPQLVHVATDGETYGHHHRFAEMALTYCLYMIESGDRELTVYGEYLEKHAPTHEVEIHENSSWSCFHGIERWRADCGCNSGSRPGWQQEWRSWLREAFDWLRDNLVTVYEEASAGLLKDCWKARDEYIRVVLDRSDANVDAFVRAHAGRDVSAQERIRVLKLLEMQRHAQLMYTSCGWFFDEISGIETVQVIQYAARALQLAREAAGRDFEEDFVRLLEKAPSNIPEFHNGAWIYENFVRPGMLDLLRVGVHYAVYSLFCSQEDISRIYSYAVESQDYEIARQGKQSMALGRVRVVSTVTGEEETISFCVLYFGDQNLIGAAAEFSDLESYARMKRDFQEGFKQGQIADVVRLVEKHFNHSGYSLWHLFKDEQRIVVRQILDAAVSEITTEFRQILAHHLSIVQVVEKLKIPLPKAFASVAEFVLNTDIREALESSDPDPEKISRAVHDLKRFSLSVDKATLNYVGTRAVTALIQRISVNLHDLSLIEKASDLMKVLDGLALDLNLWKAQNLYFSMGRSILSQMRQRAVQDPEAARWLTEFGTLGHYLRVSIG
jgi:alpha-amylase/alpha-mannosidase (GH57 family)